MRDDVDGASDSAGLRPDQFLEAARFGDRQKSENLLFRSQRLETLGMLVGGIAHDFNNILNVITGHLSLMDRWRTDPERFRRSYEAVRKATERGANTARQLLAFTRDTDVSAHEISIGDIVREVVELLKGAFPENIIFELEIDDHLPRIPADPNQIYQALLNLCVNARDAMPNGGRINIVVSERTNDGRGDGALSTDPIRFIRLAVADSGPGIEKEILARIFEPFFTTKVGSGTGLGLAVVSAVVKAHGGYIDVQSTIGEGTSFSLFFPITLRFTETPSAEPESPDLQTGYGKLPTGNGELILAIEDEKPLKDFLEAILTESGYRVLHASGGLEGLQKYKERMNDIGLVLLDMGLPEMTGTEVLSGLLLLNPKAKVISASGYLEPELRTGAMEIGAMDFLAKPYRTEELLMKVDRVLRRVQDHR